MPRVFQIVHEEDPAFKCDHLKDGDKAKKQVIKRRYTVVYLGLRVWPI